MSNDDSKKTVVVIGSGAVGKIGRALGKSMMDKYGELIVEDSESHTLRGIRADFIIHDELYKLDPKLKQRDFGKRGKKGKRRKDWDR